MESNDKTAHTKLAQFELMVDFMEEHPQLAKGQLKTSNAKASANILWKRLMEDLNSCAQPTRDVAGWKRVWADYKNHLKAKMRRNKQSNSNTGDGPSRYQHFTPVEERVIQLMSIDEAVSGSSNSERFGSVDCGVDHNM
ncbi:uncharacterized protein LOC118749765 [Rhagoletis pomonella]|uniref:uncharacterized protein LOC118749765 n=1 Tax=Rhagoletis pomonella TaxID=28610 RepID=UPI00177DA47B|nr:uncharacterized protein LOC118749765 [Rhagoletis pomonella]